MKLLKQVSLYYQEGTSDKVYQIDLLQAGDGYVVNFRYGRRGSALQEGTKTIFPVSYPEAEKVFGALELEKRKKGYVAAGEAMVAVTSTSAGSRKVPLREKAILKLLKAAVAGEESEHWPLSRIIWRAGELKMTEAVPSILRLADVTDPFNLYSVVWAIGRTKSEKGWAFLTELQKQAGVPPHVLQLADVALLALCPEAERATRLELLVESLPENLKAPVRQQDAVQLEHQVRELLFQLKTTSNTFITTLYSLSRYNGAVREVFLNVLPQVPFKLHYFRHIRQVFKAAEMLEDYLVYGLISKEIEICAGSLGHYGYSFEKRTVAFTGKTKSYLTKRLLRLLKRAGASESESYTQLACGLLLAYNDATDSREPVEERNYVSHYDTHTRRYTQELVVTTYDAYARYQVFNFILYANSNRYAHSPEGWHCVPPYKPGAPAPDYREEAFPALWNQSPQQVFSLLQYTKVKRVQEFAQKVFRSNPNFENLLTTHELVLLLQAFFLETQQLAFELVQKRYNPQTPDKALLLAVLQARLPEAREQGFRWVETARLTLLHDTQFVSDLIRINNPDTHLWLRGFLANAHFGREEAEVMIGRVVAWLLQERHPKEQAAHLSLVIDTLVIAFRENLRYISLDVVRDLLLHKEVVLQELAGKILMRHDIRPEELPEELLLILLESAHQPSRALGLQLLARFPESLLIGKKNMLVSFCLSPLPDVRRAAQPAVARLAASYATVGRELTELFVPALLRKETYEELHNDLLLLLTGDLQEHLRSLDQSRTLQLLKSNYRAAQKLGAFVLLHYVRKTDLSVPVLVELADNPLEEVRHYAWAAFEANPEKVKANKAESIRLTDAEWPDTRAFAFTYIRTHFRPDDWTPDLLVSMTDSNQEEVQAFGREMITRCFEAAQGQEYLLKLSQHPNTRIQLFTTTYLETYAHDNLQALQELQLYFVTVLSQVNKGKAAKARVMQFLRTEALRSEESANLIIGILNRVSLSVAITEKAACIKAMHDIRKAFPGIGAVVVVKEYREYVR